MSGAGFLALDYRSGFPVALREAIPIVLRDVHLFIVEEMRRAGTQSDEQDAVAISFPFACGRSDDAAPELGTRIAVCAAPPTIERLVARRGFAFRAGSSFDLRTGSAPGLVRHVRFLPLRRKLMSAGGVERGARRLARRAAERGEAFDGAKYLRQNRPQASDHPVLRIRSASNDGFYSRDLEIVHEEAPVSGPFCSFGLSRGGTTPLLDF